MSSARTIWLCAAAAVALTATPAILMAQGPGAATIAVSRNVEDRGALRVVHVGRISEVGGRATTFVRARG